jgi:hypothetical protein
MEAQMSDASQTRAIKNYLDFSNLAERERLSPAVIELFINITRLWSLDDAQALGLLGVVNTSTLPDWKNEMEGRALDEDKLMRISFLIGIFKALNICHGQNLADRWVRLPNQNPLFAGAAPVNYMMQHGCSGMKQVRRLLDARCAGH